MKKKFNITIFFLYIGLFFFVNCDDSLHPITSLDATIYDKDTANIKYYLNYYMYDSFNIISMYGEINNLIRNLNSYTSDNKVINIKFEQKGYELLRNSELSLIVTKLKYNKKLIDTFVIKGYYEGKNTIKDINGKFFILKNIDLKIRLEPYNYYSIL